MQSFTNGDSSQMHDFLIRPPLPRNPPWGSVSPLDGNELAKELDVPTRLEWINNLARRRNLIKDDPSSVTFLPEIRHRIECRQREPRLFLGVVGEFSSGKTTLINALIRQRLLRTDILQGTTAAATLISYDESLSVETRRTKKNILIRAATAARSVVNLALRLFNPPPPPPTRSELIEALNRATSEEEFARDIVQVNVTLPSASLRDGVVIVDTPGANASNPRHGRVTARALQDICDAAIVTVPADMPASESLLQFLRTHAADVIHRCIFVVTKVDLLRRESDRSRVLENVRARVSTLLGLTNPRVLAAAPHFVVSALPKDPSDCATEPPSDDNAEDAAERSGWINHFEAMEAELRHLLKEKRLQAQADDIGKLLEQLYHRLKHAIEVQLTEYRTRHESLERIVIPDIHGFIAQRRARHCDLASNAVARVLRGLHGELTDLGVEVVRRLNTTIGEASNRAELKTAMESAVPRVINQGESRIKRHVDRVLNQISGAVQSELEVFHREFQEHYRSLATLGGTLSHDKRIGADTVREFSAVATSLSATLASTVSNSSNERNQRMVGGGAAGAVIGTFLLPGIGTLIGGLAGSLLSSMFGPSLDELKEGCWQPLRDSVCSHLDDAIPELVLMVENAGEHSLMQLSDVIDEYAPKYERLVEEMRARDAADKINLANAQRAVEADLVAIDQQQAFLASMQRRIRDM